MTVFSPYDNPVTESKSDMTATNFGGRREHSQTANGKDYTSRTNAAPDKIENPEDVVMDIDDLVNENEKKSEFSYQDVKSDCQKGNEDNFMTKSDAENRPVVGEGSDPVVIPDTGNVKRHRKPNQWQFGTESIYEGEVS